MALVCNDPTAAAATLADLAGFSDPAAHARLVALRARPPRDQGLPALRESRDWQQATAQLAAALGRPSLELHG